ncbi:MAG: helix-turn-helix transcriptional regulator [Phycicoccus sp.]
MRRIDPWALVLLAAPVLALVDRGVSNGISLVDPMAWASWWWAPSLWAAQVVPLVWRRRRPGLVVLLVTAALLAGQWLVPLRTLADLGVVLAVYSVAAWGDRRAVAATAVVGTSVIAVTGVLLGVPAVGGIVPMALLVVAAPLVAGETMRQRRVASSGLPRPTSPATTHAPHLPPPAPMSDSAWPDPLPGYERLSPREREVLDLVADGLSNPEIAGRLHVSRETVKSHVTALLHKLDCRDRVQLAIVVHRGAPAASPGPVPSPSGPRGLSTRASVRGTRPG